MNSKKILLNIFSWLAVVLTMIMIVNFSVENGEESTETSNNVVDVVIETLPNKENITPEQKDNIGGTIRKLAHFGIYMLLGLSLANAFKVDFANIMPYPLILAFAGSLQFSLFDEFVLQANTSGRAAEWNDIFIDSMGAIIGIIIYSGLLIIINAINKINKRKSLN